MTRDLLRFFEQYGRYSVTISHIVVTNCLSWMSLYPRQTMSRFQIFFRLSSVWCSVVVFWVGLIPWVVQHIGSVDVFLKHVDFFVEISKTIWAKDSKLKYSAE